MRWALIEARVVCRVDRADTVLLPPERRACQLIGEGVAVVRRGGQRDDARVCVGNGTGGHEHEENRIPKDVVRRTEPWTKPGKRPAESHPQGDRTAADRNERDEEARPIE